jgi:hypothetical protein
MQEEQRKKTSGKRNKGEKLKEEKKEIKKDSLQVTSAVSEGEYRNYLPFHTKKRGENWR